MNLKSKTREEQEGGKREKKRLRGRKEDLCHKTKKPSKLQKISIDFLVVDLNPKKKKKKMHIPSKSSSPSIGKSNPVSGCILIILTQNLINDPDTTKTTPFQSWIQFHFRSKQGGVHHLQNLGAIIEMELALFRLCSSRVLVFWGFFFFFRLSDLVFFF